MHHLKMKKKTEQMLVFFKRLGSLYYLSFTSHEILRNKIIGLDKLRKKILIIEDANYRYDSKFIDLCEVKACKLKKVYSSIQAEDFKSNKLEKYLSTIALEFNFKTENTPFAFEFYRDTTHSVYEMAELESKARQWETMLSKILPGTAQKLHS